MAAAEEYCCNNSEIRKKFYEMNGALQVQVSDTTMLKEVIKRVTKLLPKNLTNRSQNCITPPAATRLSFVWQNKKNQNQHK